MRRGWVPSHAAPGCRPGCLASVICLAPPPAADILDGCKVGDTVKVEVLRRGGQRKVLNVQLAERQPENTE